MTLEEALRERYLQVKANIARDQKQMDDLRDKTDLRHGFQKREFDAIKERKQVEYYKHDEIREIARRAGVKL